MRNKAEWLSLEDLWGAYEDCRYRKRNTESCAKFEFDEIKNIYDLWKDLNNKTYEIGYSNAFIVTRPKLREVFAADFRDRIVHHLIIMKTLPLFESNFIQDTYNCRKQKGTLYGIERVKHKIGLNDNCWILKLDLQGFFMSINKEMLRDKLRSFIFENYKGEDINEIWWLMDMIVMHNPERKCIIKGDKTKLDSLPASKSLLKGDGSKGMAIGNLTSQIFANFYLSDLDNYLSSIPNVEYGRYVDDFILIGVKSDLLRILHNIKDWLWDNLQVKLHPDKIYLQQNKMGVSFVGAVLKDDRTYINNRTVGNCIATIKHYNKLSESSIENEIERFAQRFNSYMGFMIHHKTYAIRWKLWNLISDDIKKFVYMTNGMKTLKVRKKYKTITKLLEKYGSKRKFAKRSIRSDEKGIWYVDRSRSVARSR